MAGDKEKDSRDISRML